MLSQSTCDPAMNPSTPKDGGAACECIDKINALLEPKNAALNVNLLNPTYTFVQLVKADTSKRGKLPLMAASYCPFCGVKHNHDEAAND